MVVSLSPRDDKNLSKTSSDHFKATLPSAVVTDPDNSLIDNNPSIETV